VDVLPEDEMELAGRLIEDYGCVACHAEQERSVGPSYTEIAERYAGSDVSEQLKKKIAEGGSGTWGPVNMPANPGIPDQELDMLVQYILGFSPEGHQE
ncbi:MAG: c-type cytochrome, partial [Bacteroidota bacterium]